MSLTSKTIYHGNEIHIGISDNKSSVRVLETITVTDESGTNHEYVYIAEAGYTTSAVIATLYPDL